jgi:hypothetical protein
LKPRPRPQLVEDKPPARPKKYASLASKKVVDPYDLIVPPPSVEEGAVGISTRISAQMQQRIQEICVSQKLKFSTPGEVFRSAIYHFVNEVIGDNYDNTFTDDVKQSKMMLSMLQRKLRAENAASLMAKAAELIRLKYVADPVLGAKEWLRLDHWFEHEYKGQTRDWAINQWRTRGDVADARSIAMTAKASLLKEIAKEDGDDSDD